MLENCSALPHLFVALRHLAVGQHQWYHFGVGEFTTHFRTYFSGWIGMFTGANRFGF